MFTIMLNADDLSTPEINHCRKKIRMIFSLIMTTYGISHKKNAIRNQGAYAYYI